MLTTDDNFLVGLNALPPLYDTEEVPALEKTLHARFFTTTGCQWWFAEYSEEEGIAFGFAILNHDSQNAEWGYVSIAELLQVNEAYEGKPFGVERDHEWVPCIVRDSVIPHLTD